MARLYQGSSAGEVVEARIDIDIDIVWMLMLTKESLGESSRWCARVQT
jgi:hypothetical protein